MALGVEVVVGVEVICGVEVMVGVAVICGSNGFPQATNITDEDANATVNAIVLDSLLVIISIFEFSLRIVKILKVRFRDEELTIKARIHPSLYPK